VGKCFHPACGRAVTLGGLSADYHGSLYEVLDKIKEDCHRHLLSQVKPGNGYAYPYLVNERGIPCRVLTDLTELGAVPPGYDMGAAFEPALGRAQAREAELLAKIEESLRRWVGAKEERQQAHQAGRQKAPATAKGKTEQEKKWEDELKWVRGTLQWLEEKRAELSERLAAVSGWIVFCHTDARHRVRSLRFRKPFEKRFQSWTMGGKGGSGLFGHGLFRPYLAADRRPQNRLVLVEGEINLLQIHSLMVRAARPGEDDKPGLYANWVGAVGSASTVDVGTVKALLATPGAVGPPVVIQDHDDAGDEMVKRLGLSLTLEVVKPPVRDQDIDDFLRAFKGKHREALKAFRDLLDGRRLVLRPFESLAAQVYEARQKQGKDDQRREFEIHSQVKDIILPDLKGRGKFYYQYQQGYYFWEEHKRLIALDDGDKELSILLDRYGLNATEKAHEYLAEALHIEALTNGTPTRVHRFAWFDRDALALYVYNHASGVYRITADCVELADNGTDGVLFLYNRQNEPFALAEDAAGCEDLFHRTVASGINFAPDYHLTAEEQQAVFQLWFLSTFFGSLLPTRPLLAFIGPKGSGKSFALRRVGVLLFGSRFEVKNLPDKEDSFDAVTTNSHFAAFDNADSRVAWLPDRLATCATGGTVSKRVLYTTNTLADFPIDCFLGLTSRTPHFRRDDVADRLLIFHVRRFEDGQFVAEEELLGAVLRDRDRILADVVRQLQEAIGALRATAGRPYKTAFRMADFGTFALRLADAGGGREAMEGLFGKLCEEQAAFTLEGDPLAELLPRWLAAPGNPGRPADAATLYKELGALAEAEKLEFSYRSSRALGQRLGNVLHNLKAILRVQVIHDPHRKQKLYQFWPLSG
jgi:hypothetical protein